MKIPWSQPWWPSSPFHRKMQLKFEQLPPSFSKIQAFLSYDLNLYYPMSTLVKFEYARSNHLIFLSKEFGAYKIDRSIRSLLFSQYLGCIDCLWLASKSPSLVNLILFHILYLLHLASNYLKETYHLMAKFKTIGTSIIRISL